MQVGWRSTAPSGYAFGGPPAEKDEGELVRGPEKQLETDKVVCACRIVQIQSRWDENEEKAA